MASSRTRLDAGKRDLLVTIQQRSTTNIADEDSSEPVEVWTTLVGAMPVGRTTVSGWERFRMDQVSARGDERWEMNYRPDMDPDLIDVPKTRRLVFGERVLDIVHASHIGRRAGIELLTVASSAVPT